MELGRPVACFVIMALERLLISVDQDLLLYPLDTGEDPVCPGCSTPMVMATREAREDGKAEFIAFRCERCGRTEKFICEE